MLEPGHGDLLAARVDALVNAVNTHGVMGKGIALQFKIAYPAAYRGYRAACAAKALDIGQIYTHPIDGPDPPHHILHFPTKRHWRDPSRLEYIRLGLPALTAEVRRLKLRSLALPALGCGLGGLAWADVLPCIEAAFAPLPDVQVLVYAPR